MANKINSSDSHYCVFFFSREPTNFGIFDVFMFGANTIIDKLLLLTIRHCIPRNGIEFVSLFCCFCVWLLSIDSCWLCYGYFWHQILCKLTSNIAPLLLCFAFFFVIQRFFLCVIFVRNGKLYGLSQKSFFSSTLDIDLNRLSEPSANLCAHNPVQMAVSIILSSVIEVD